MTTWPSILIAILLAVASFLISNWLKRKIANSEEIVYDVKLPSTETQQISIARDSRDDADSRVQKVLLASLTSMRGSEMTPESTAASKRLVIELEKQRERAPLSRQIIILLANAYRNLGDLRRAIEVLSEYIKNKVQFHQLDVDLSDALYNRACFFSLLGNFVAAREDLTRSIQLRPENLELAQRDVDLKGLLEHLPRFAAEQAQRQADIGRL